MKELAIIINNDLSIDYNGDINILNKGLVEIPIRFRHVKERFEVYSIY